MIFGIGIDLCETKRIKAIYQRFGDKFAHRILTEDEYTQFKTRTSPAPFLATRFAAKEAAVKALGTGFTQGIGFQDIEIRNQASGKPSIAFLGNAKKVKEESQIISSFLSLSDEKHNVVAMVLLEVD